MEPKVNSVPKEKMLEMKQAFLSSAISDIGVRTILNFANVKSLYVFRTALSLEITLESHIAR